MNEGVETAIKNWIPYKLLPQHANEELLCKWLYLGNELMTAPFFDQTISQCKSLPQNSKLKSSVSSVSIFEHWSKQINSIEPTAFVFHVSRCGSTLLSQLLSVQAENIVLSEVPFFDELLRTGFNLQQMNELLSVLKSSIKLYGARRNSMQKNLFVKTDSWHIHFYKELRVLYPDVPFIFLYRRPDEVIRSHQKLRGMQAVPGVIEPALFGFDANEVMQMNFDEYTAEVLESYMRAFINILKSDKNSMAINYNEGAMNMMYKIAAFTKLPISADDEAVMIQRAGFHAKYPGEKFSEPSMNDAPPLYMHNAFTLYNELGQIKNS
jgi:hypothetical protein